jgi:hypothetical protein
MLNDQRRKLSAHFENLDLHRLELQLPFFDGAFLESVIATPLDWCLRHQFYVKMLPLFPPAVTEVPWQAYPGHQPCPLPVLERTQLSMGSLVPRARRGIAEAGSCPAGFCVAAFGRFPGSTLDQKKSATGQMGARHGWRDYRYAIEAAHTYYSYWKKCDGNFSLSVS